MFSGIRTFGESLKMWMEEKGLTPPDLAAYTRETRDATIARMMHDQLDYQRCARFITELAESYPDIDEETLRRLRVAVDVNRYGKELYLAKHNFSRMILGKSKELPEDYSDAESFCNELLAWSESKTFKLLCMGLTDTEPQRLLNLLCEKRKNIHIYDFYDRTHIKELSSLLAETLSIAFNPNFELYEIEDDQGIMMNNIIIARREDGEHLLIVHDSGQYSTLRISDKTELFDFCFNLLLARHHTPKKINFHFNHNSPIALKVFLAHCQSTEKDKAIYHIKTEVGLEYVPISIIVNNFTDWARTNNERLLFYIDDLKEILEQRYINIISKADPTYLIMTKEGMTEFVRTGRMKDHPFCLRTFTPEERKEILLSLLDLVEKSVSFIPLFFSDSTLSLNHSFIGYSRECILICAAHADYDLSNYTEIVLESGELAGQFADYVTTILTKGHLMSKKASLDFIRSRISLVPEK